MNRKQIQHKLKSPNASAIDRQIRDRSSEIDMANSGSHLSALFGIFVGRCLLRPPLHWCAWPFTWYGCLRFSTIYVCDKYDGHHQHCWHCIYIYKHIYTYVCQTHFYVQHAVTTTLVFIALSNTHASLPTWQSQCFMHPRIDFINSQQWQTLQSAGA